MLRSSDPCPKCGHESIPVWEDPTYICVRENPLKDHLIYTCRSCGYKKQKQCKDAEEK